MKKFLSKDEGFTLIELMVVVAIIGILSAIAVPNFKKYQAKSKQSEAKIQLASVYTVETGSMADYDAYATCIDTLGYDKSPRGYYVVGFGAAEVTLVAARNANCAVTNFAFNPTVHLKAGATTATVKIAAATSIVSKTGDTFIAGADGNISAALLDQWTITQTKTLTNTAVGY
jgi:type IV pilus assembly protein PilA